MHVGAYVYLATGGYKGQKKVSDTMELLLQAVVSYLECVLRTKSALNRGKKCF